MHPEEPILDEFPLRALDGLPGGRESVLELIGIFEEDVPIRIAALKQLLAEGLCKDASIEAHSLKGGAGNMGLVRFAAIAKDLEFRLRDEQNPDCGSLVAALEVEFPPALVAMKAAFPPRP